MVNLSEEFGYQKLNNLLYFTVWTAPADEVSPILARTRPHGVRGDRGGDAE